MDPRLKLLIDSVRESHTPIWWVRNGANLAKPYDPWCVGCKDLVPWKTCPVRVAADELEKEYGDESS